ncbi:MAG: C1 family peptidase [Candidatus Pacebacteria bacterium]|nr:C1 family peptidase [Candidatus Paceibacterota bacterium]
MKLSLILSLLLLLQAALPAATQTSIFDTIRTHDPSWKQQHPAAAARPSKNFVFSPQRNLVADYHKANTRSASAVLPSRFDWRETPAGQRCVPKVLNQGTCGSCYAFAAVQVFAARYCQANPSLQAEDCSPQDLLACSRRNAACDGGFLDDAFEYIEEYGIASLSCQPYVENTTGEVATTKEKCMPLLCNSGDPVRKKFCKQGSGTVVYGTERVKREIVARGPVATDMTAWDDFSYYTGGIYRHTYGKGSGGHAVALFGWGLDSATNVSYWIVMNSWGPEWGENGFIRIDMADTDSNVGQSAYFCLPASS